MTCDDFEMDPHFSSWRGKTEWNFKVGDGDMKIEFSVYDADIQTAVEENFDHFTGTIENELMRRVENAWDLGEISDAERRVFLVILEKVIG